MKAAVAFLLAASAAFAQIRTVARPSQSPLVTFRIVFTTGAAADPPGKPGLAYLTARMLADGGTRDLTYKQIVDALFPMAASVGAQVDQEMTTFSGSTHIDNLAAYYGILRSMLLEPGWRDDDFQRVKDDAINFLRVNLRGNNDEELGKEVLYQTIYAGTPYGHYSAGTVSSLEKLTLADLKEFYRTRYTQANLILGIAGGYPPRFLAEMKKDFGKLPARGAASPKTPAPEPTDRNRVVIVDKETRSVAYSIGFPIDVTRASPDYVPLLVASSYLGQHRESGGVLFDQMREKRGLNYGDYAYVEYFPRGMFLFQPDPNLARRSQIFQIWIRPVEPPTAKFALRLALYELDKLVKEGISEDGFERTRDFLSKYVNVLTSTKRAELGYAIDSLYYGIPEYNLYLKNALAKLTREDVNHAIRRHLRSDRVIVAAVTGGGEAFKREIVDSGASPMTYNSPKPAAITTEDKVVERWPLHLRPEDVTVLPVSKVFE